ncbi:MAG: hypothetical protein A3F90_06900 [Deltaproteobacteria bacterium RIFCSPLOWO2_12_FULL_60_19]|nr:MAG: hypothetical protein A3F90_06900 [Deltaproteobacteria bacterium RIFCSPLOWO2_12_FULL_60_19]
MRVTVNRCGIKTAFCAGSLLLLFLGEADANIYQCLDSQGSVLFTDSPTQAGCKLLIGRRPTMTTQSGGSPTRYDEIILSAAERHGVDPALVRAVVKAESDFNETARSRKGAQGLMQLMPETARLHNVANVYDPGENIEGGVQHLRLLLDRYRGDLRLALAAYNAGIQAVEKHGGIPPFAETKEYVRRVLTFHDRYRKNGQISITEQVSQ